MKFRPLQRVVLIDSGYIVPRGMRGRFVKYDYTRSKDGFSALVVWCDKLSKKKHLRTWVNPKALAPLD